MAADATLRLDRVDKTYGRHRALTDVSLEFRPAQVAAVLGPNGAGKSTLLGILSTLVPPVRRQRHLGGRTAGPQLVAAQPHRLRRPRARASTGT